MYSIGDLIVYGSTGVCEIIDIKERSFNKKEKGRLYYILKPLYQGCTISVPVDNTKVFMRPVITKEEADELIDMIPNMQVEAYHNRVLNQLAEHYNESLRTHDCSDLLELTMSIYAKKQYAEQQKRKFGVIDERYMKRAEELLFGELAAVLKIPKEEVPNYINVRINKSNNS